MAYLRDITTKCERCRNLASTTTPATVELVNNRNAVIGRYCARCGRVKLRELQERERAAGEWSG